MKNDSASVRNTPSVVFDLDGTLLNTLHDIARSFNRILGSHGFPIHPVHEYRRFVGRGLMNALIKSLPPDHGLDEMRLEKLLTEITAVYAQDPAAETVPYPGMHDLLRRLNQAGIPVAVLSNKDHALTVPITAACLPDILFSEVRGSIPGRPLKPDPESVLEIIRSLGSEPGMTIMVGDSPVDFQTAERAGMKPLLVGWGFNTPQELLLEGCSPVIETAGDLEQRLFSLLESRS
jgi:phosphoglycolate phosphatase